MAGSLILEENMERERKDAKWWIRNAGKQPGFYPETIQHICEDWIASDHVKDAEIAEHRRHIGKKDARIAELEVESESLALELMRYPRSILDRLTAIEKETKAHAAALDCVFGEIHAIEQTGNGLIKELSNFPCEQHSRIDYYIHKIAKLKFGMPQAESKGGSDENTD